MKKVSIAVAVYNEEEHLKRCLDSLINQTYQNIEIILVDDCSTDNSLQICYEYAKRDSRIVVVEKESHTVLSDVRNIGIDHATGEYIMFVDSDDYVCENFVEEMVKAIEEKNVDAVMCKPIYKNDEECVTASTQWFSDKVYKGEELIEISKIVVEIDQKNMLHNTWLFIIKLDKLKTRFDNNVYSAQDVIFFVELILESISSLYFLDKALYYYCYNVNGITYNINNYKRYMESILNLRERLKIIFSRNNCLNEELERKIILSTFQRIKNKMFYAKGLTVLRLRKMVKYTLKNKRVVEVKKSYNVENMNYKSKVYKALVKLHFYFLIAICMKISVTKASLRRRFKR